MPIKPENKKRYPKDWNQVRERILERAGNCCEGSPKFPDCRVPNYSEHPDTGSRVVLTVAHLNHTPEDISDDNLRAWCQRCHLHYDLEHHKQNAAKTRRKKKSQTDWLDEAEKP